MSAIFAGLSREDRVLPAEERRLKELLASERGWRVSVIGTGEGHTQALTERADFHLYELRRERPVDVAAATMRKLLPVKSECRRVTKVLPPTSRKQLEACQRQGLFPRSLVRSAHSAVLSDDDTPKTSLGPQTRDELAVSDVMLRHLCPYANHTALPFVADVDPGSVIAATSAHLFCTTMAAFHGFATLVWMLLEAAAQRRCFQSVTELVAELGGDVSRIGDGASVVGYLPPLVHNAVSVARDAWITFRTRGVRSDAPCGAAAVLLTPNRNFLVNDAEVFTVTHRQPDFAQLQSLWNRLAGLFRESGGLLLAQPWTVVTGKEVPAPRLWQVKVSDHARLIAELQSFSGLDAADALCYVGVPLLMHGSQLQPHQRPMIAQDRVELSKHQRCIMESWLIAHHSSRVTALSQSGPALQWLVRRPTSAELMGVRDTKYPTSRMISLAVMHKNGALSHVGTPLEIAQGWGSRETKSATAHGPYEHAHRVLENTLPAQLSDRHIATFVSAVVTYGSSLRMRGAEAVSIAASTGDGAPLLRTLNRKLLIPAVRNASALMTVLQSHPDAKYIAGCGVRCMYITGDGRLVVERVCFRFCEWDYRLCFGAPEGTKSKSLLPPRPLTQATVRHCLPRSLHYSRVKQAAVVDMLLYYRIELRRLVEEQPDAVPDGRMMLHPEDNEVVKYVVSHHPKYFARRGCGFEAFFVTLDPKPRSSSAKLVTARTCHGGVEDGLALSHGYCFALRHCGTVVGIATEECYESDDTLCLPFVLHDPLVHGKRPRTEATAQQP